ncbi:hypothetical protein NP493_528g00031 [Ridgeia piscesae]|uniref:G-protein coupled receptors family 1 profile domain-containing protein n=1 Tax=Ridgeia piscesae TaxID=27915 RepID=A0AAD9NSA0_RIDPI|nr:hypothetical protein NP493_528g00031 [Ridgeia piscesae]
MEYTPNLNNTTLDYYDDGDLEIGQDKINFESAQYYCYAILHPVIFTIGVTGNMMNLVVFTRQRMRHGKSDIEKAATTGLIFLAVSDMMYCLTGLMTHFLRPFRNDGTTAAIVVHYYGVYTPAILNTFQFISTWLTVTVAIERYFAVTYPFMARQIANPRRTAILGLVVYGVSIVFNIPLFLHKQIARFPGPDGETFYIIVDGVLPSTLAYTITWSALGILVPLVTLAFCNVRFLVIIRRSQARFTPNNAASDNSRRNPLLNSTTITLISIICLFFLLVCPAMIIQFIGNFVQHLSLTSYYRFQLAVVVTNTMLVVNFAINFLLYCYALRDFRKTLANMVRSRGPSSHRLQRLS